MFRRYFETNMSVQETEYLSTKSRKIVNFTCGQGKEERRAV